MAGRLTHRTNRGPNTGVLPDGGFFDDFAGTAINETDWIVYDRLGDQSNSEAQSYKPSNVTVAGSILTLTARKENYTVGDFYRAPSLRSYTSGAVQWKTYNFTRGTFEARARMTCNSAHGAWPAIWLIGHKGQDTHHLTADDVDDFVWPTAGGSEEIDVAEAFGANATANRLVMKLWSGANSPGVESTADDLTAWHTYKMTWAVGVLTFFVDNVQRGQISQAYVPSTAMFLQMNIAMGGAGGAITDGDYPATMDIDWVRVTPP